MADPISAFKDFMLGTREAPLSGVEEIRNEATKYRTYLLRRMMAGLADEKMLQSGTSIVDQIQLKMTSTYQDYLPTQDFELTGTNSLTQLSVPWRFSIVHSVWYDHEILLNSGDLKTRFKNVKKAKEQEMMLSLYEGMEDALWAKPDVTNMESGASGRTPYSIPCFVTTDGLAPSSGNSITGGVTGANWSTVMTVSPSTFANWRNQVQSYDPSSDTTVASTLPDALALMWQDVQFQSPTSSQQYFQDTNLSKLCIFTDAAGWSELLKATRTYNNRILDLGFQNATISYAGIPVERIGALDGYNWTNPQYLFLNFNYIRPIFHTERYFYPIDVDGGPTQPQAHATYRDTWRNLWCDSRRQQGVVIPVVPQT